MTLLRSMARAAAALTFVAVFSDVAARADNAPPLAPHRASYDLTLLKGEGTKAPVQARGRIAFDFTGSACDGYIQNFRQITELTPEEGTPQASDMTSATFESGDGSDYRFKVTTKTNGVETEETDGVAKKGKSPNLQIELNRPKRGKHEIAGAVLFPTEHMRRIIAAAREGQKLLSARVYDGSGDGAKVFDSLTVIGAPAAAPATEKPFQVDAFKNVRRWPVSISYFEADQKDQPPSYVLILDLYENGVTRSLKLDYGDFVLGATASSLTLLPPAKCDK